MFVEIIMSYTHAHDSTIPILAYSLRSAEILFITARRTYLWAE